MNAAQIHLYKDRLRFREEHNTILPWMSNVEFRLPLDVAEDFSKEEQWLYASFSCSVCGEEKGGSDRASISAGCTHESTVCTACLG